MPVIAPFSPLRKVVEPATPATRASISHEVGLASELLEQNTRLHSQNSRLQSEVQRLREQIERVRQEGSLAKERQQVREIGSIQGLLSQFQCREDCEHERRYKALLLASSPVRDQLL